MRNIQGVKIGSTVNISIDGKLHKKNCNSSEKAKELFGLVLEAKENPSDENIKKIRLFLNEKTRIAMMAGLESDYETGEVYLAGFNTPIPMTLVEVIRDYHNNNFPIDAIINFWKLLMINPDQRVRTSLFDFITTHDFVLTDMGYMLVYKAVYTKSIERLPVKASTYFSDAVTGLYNKIRNWKCAPKNYVVYRSADGEYKATEYKAATDLKWVRNNPDAEILGNLNDLYAALVSVEPVVAEPSQTVYTDMHTRKMNIIVGEVVVMDRKDCDSDPAIDCSYGLHVGATKYVENFGNGSSTILACLVNPANVVAVPNYDHSKMRVSEYFPVGTANFVNGRIEIVEQSYFESDYVNIEIEELEDQVQKLIAKELPIETAIDAKEETRSMSELTAMIELRLYDLYDVVDPDGSDDDDDDDYDDDDDRNPCDDCINNTCEGCDADECIYN